MSESEYETDPADDAEIRRVHNKYKADFLWGYADDSVEEAGYEFVNAKTEEYREYWWYILKSRLATRPVPVYTTEER